MALPIASLLALSICCGPAPCGRVATTCFVSCDHGTPHVVCLPAGRAGAGAAVAYAGPMVLVRNVGSGEDDPVAAAEKLPKHWIGVRTTPVPEPLAAHLGTGGVMIANVAKGSPADLGGLERYDVLLTFGGQKIDSMEDLLGAVGDAKPGVKSELLIIRKGEKQTVKIAPVERPDSTNIEFKYEEPAEDMIDRSLNLRGRMLRLGPGGDWVMEDLGPFRRFPDVLKHFYAWDLLKGFSPEDLKIDVKVFGDEEDMDVDAPAGAKVEVRVKVDQDGRTTTIHRDADGKIHVDKTDADGNKSSAAYENAKEFEKADPEAFELYGPHAGHRGMMWQYRVPPTGQLDDLHKRFQVEVQKKLEKAAERSKEAVEKAYQSAQEAQERARVIIKKRAGDDSAAEGMSLSVQVHDDGSITITTAKGGKRTVHEFESRDDLKKSDPKLYEKVKNLLE